MRGRTEKVSRCLKFGSDLRSPLQSSLPSLPQWPDPFNRFKRYSNNRCQVQLKSQAPQHPSAEHWWHSPQQREIRKDPKRSERQIFLLGSGQLRTQTLCSKAPWKVGRCPMLLEPHGTATTLSSPVPESWRQRFVTPQWRKHGENMRRCKSACLSELVALVKSPAVAFCQSESAIFFVH